MISTWTYLRTEASANASWRLLPKANSITTHALPRARADCPKALEHASTLTMAAALILCLPLAAAAAGPPSHAAAAS